MIFTFSNPNHVLAGPPPHYPPMDEFWYTVSTGINSQEFAKDTQVAVPLFPNICIPTMSHVDMRA